LVGFLPMPDLPCGLSIRMARFWQRAVRQFVVGLGRRLGDFLPSSDRTSVSLHNRAAIRRLFFSTMRKPERWRSVLLACGLTIPAANSLLRRHLVRFNSPESPISILTRAAK